MSNVSTEVDAAGVATIVLSLEGRVPSFTRAATAELAAAFAELAPRRDVRCVVLTGPGTGESFIVGADVDELRSQSHEQRIAFNHELLDLTQAARALPMPTIACLNGHTVGGGLELALACSIRVAEEGTRIGLPEARIGLIPGAGGAIRLPRLIGRGPALRMLLTGDLVSARRALELGLVDELAAPGEGPALAQRLAARIAANSPHAVRGIEAVVEDTAQMPEGEAVELVHDRLRALFSSDQFDEGVDAFRERRPATFEDA